MNKNSRTRNRESTPPGGDIQRTNRPKTATPQEAEVSPATARAKSVASEVSDTLHEESVAVANTAREAGRETVEVVKEEVRDGARAVRSSALDVAEDRRKAVARKAEEYSRAARAAASTLQEEQDKELAAHIEQFAERLNVVSEYLSRHNISDLGRDLGDVTRKHPELVLGGAALLGFAATRFLKSSSHEHARRIATGQVGGAAHFDLRPSPSHANPINPAASHE